MVPRFDDRELVLLATGTGVAPLVSLARHLLTTGYPQPISLWWGLRSADDICLTDELDDLADAHDGFTYAITRSQPPDDGWTGPRGRLGQSVPPLLPTLGPSGTTWSATGPCSRRWRWRCPTWGSCSSTSTRSRTSTPSTGPIVTWPGSGNASWPPTCSRPTPPGGARSSTLDRDLEAARTGKAGNGDPLAVSDRFDLLRAFLSHHPDRRIPSRPMSSVPGTAPTDTESPSAEGQTATSSAQSVRHARWRRLTATEATTAARAKTMNPAANVPVEP